MHLARKIEKIKPSKTHLARKTEKIKTSKTRLAYKNFEIIAMNACFAAAAA